MKNGAVVKGKRQKADSAPELAATGGNSPALTPAEIKEQLERTGDLENGAVGDTVLPEGEVRGAEHLRAAEGAMTFRSLSDGANAWLDEQLATIAKEHKTGAARGGRKKQSKLKSRFQKN